MDKQYSAALVRSLEIYDSPEYWCGDLGYRPPGYQDFVINSVKEAVIILSHPKNVLDLGCAFAFTVDRLRLLGVSAFGVDASEYALSKADARVRPFLYRAALWNLPFEDNTFDFAFSSGVLEHIPEDKLGLTILEINRVCSRGIFGIAVTDDVTSQNDEDVSHSNLKSIKEWEAIVPSAFKIISDSESYWRVQLARMLYEEVLCKQ